MRSSETSCHPVCGDLLPPATLVWLLYNSAVSLPLLSQSLESSLVHSLSYLLGSIAVHLALVGRSLAEPPTYALGAIRIWALAHAHPWSPTDLGIACYSQCRCCVIWLVHHQPARPPIPRFRFLRPESPARSWCLPYCGNLVLSS